MTSAMTRCGDWLISTPDWHQSWAVWLVIGLGERLIQKSEMTYLGYKPTISGCQKLPYKASKLTILKKLATKMQTIWPCGGWPWGATNPYTIRLPPDSIFPFHTRSDYICIYSAAYEAAGQWWEYDSPPQLSPSTSRSHLAGSECK